MVDKYMTLADILATRYSIEWDGDQECWRQYFIEGGKKVLVAAYLSDDDMDDWSDEDAMAHWLSMGRTWNDEDFFEPKPEKPTRILKMRDED